MQCGQPGQSVPPSLPFLTSASTFGRSTAQWVEAAWNERVLFIDMDLFPMCSRASEWASEWMNEHASEVCSAEPVRRMSKRCERTSKWTREWPSGLCVNFMPFPPNLHRCDSSERQRANSMISRYVAATAVNGKFSPACKDVDEFFW